MKTIRILPLNINGEVVSHKNDLKNYPVQDSKHTLFTVYAKMIREHDDRSFADYLQAYCDNVGVDNPYTITPLNSASRQWKDIVSSMVSDETVEAVVNNVVSVALGQSRDAIKAAELIAKWKGAEEKISVDLKADVEVKPKLFDL